MDASTPPASRVVLVGDTGVGKSALVARIAGRCAALAGGGAAERTAAERSAADGRTTVGTGINVCVWPTGPVGSGMVEARSPTHGAGAGGKGRLLELIDVGGSRSFSPAARAVFYAAADAFLIVHDPASPRTTQSALFWFEELRAAGALANGVPFAVVATERLPAEAVPHRGAPKAREGGDVVGRGIDAAAATVRAVLPASAAAALAAVALLFERLTLLAMSFVLFGPGQRVVPLRPPPSPQGALAAVDERAQADGGGGYWGEVGPVCLDDAALYGHSADGLHEFLASVLGSTAA